MNQVYIADLKDRLGEVVTIAGWLSGVRSSGKIAFLQLRDGTGQVQGVMVRSEVAPETWEGLRRLPQETSLTLRGEVRPDARAPSGVELGVLSAEIVGASSEYPITPKEHGVEFLLDHRHLYLRHRRPWAIMRIRDELARGITDFFADRGFIRFDAPLFMPTAVEGTTNLFEIRLFEEESAYLSQSGQLYAEAGAMAFGKVYTYGPTFRAEKSKTRRHLLEFWMVEPEVAFLDHEGNMDLQEAMLSYLVGRILSRRSAELEMLERDPRRLEPAAAGNYPRIDYDEALRILAGSDHPLVWGEDLGAPHETILGEHFDRPLMIEAWPAQAKAFYMEPWPGDERLVCANDVIAPEGYGEIIGGSQRIHDLELLNRRIADHGLPEKAFGWYLDLRRFGTVPHAGFGLGLERTLAWITGAQHLREVIPFPRMLTRLYP